MSANQQQEKLSTPRTGHYLLAHTALRQICETDPKYFFKVFASSDQKIYLQSILDQVKEHCGDEPLDFGTEDVEIVMGRNGGYPLLVFTMPQPKAYNECYNVALVLLADINRPSEEEKVGFKCYTQELSQTEDGQDCVSLCEWQGEQHLVHGIINSSSVEDLGQAVKDLLDPDQAAE